MPTSEIINDSAIHLDYPIFEKSIDVFKPMDWHLDLASGKRFPQVFAHGIDIRSDKFGSAKHVWEVNRLLFLTHIASLYKKTGERRYLELVMFHLASWKNANPYMVGVNWYSNIEVNIRLINWAFCWDLLDAENLRQSDAEFDMFVRNVWLPLIFEHAKYSDEHRSLYSSANNHLISEYAGLFVAACCWKIPNREKRLACAKAGLEREILLQNTAEGVNREEAAEYIQFIDDFFLIAAVLGRRFGIEFSEGYNRRLHEMARYMNAFLDCGWNYPMYGDGDDGFVLRPDAGGHFNNFKSLLTSFAVYFADADLKREGAAWDEKNQLLLGDEGRAAFLNLASSADESLDGCKFFGNSGHFIFRKVKRDACADDALNKTACETYLHFDAAPLGFLSIAAHGHADALSFILHVDGHPVIVDPGTFTYHTHKDLRRYFVATSSHNTVCINDKNQAMQAGPTMWLNHYKVKVVSADESRAEVVATHSGYDTLGVTHVRKVNFNRDEDEFVITDTLKSDSPCCVEIPFILHPEVIAELDGNRATLSWNAHVKVLVTLDEKISYAVSQDEWYSEHFGEKVPTSALRAKVQCEGPAQFTTRIKVLR